MSKKLVAYFSAGGNTARLAKKLADAAAADLYEIKPAVPYTREDLNWQNKQSRSSVEMNDHSSRPALAPQDADIASYDTIYIGSRFGGILHRRSSIPSWNPMISQARRSFCLQHPAAAASDRLSGIFSPAHRMRNSLRARSILLRRISKSSHLCEKRILLRRPADPVTSLKRDPVLTGGSS